jgi:hypothetical protein
MRNDPWLLPTNQTDYPTRATLSASLLHGRREATFLALAAIVVASTAVAVLLGADHVVDLSAVIAGAMPGIEPAIEMQLPLGALALPVGLAAILLACELYGRRRAVVLATVNAFVAAAMVGVAAAVDRVDGTGAALGGALAFGAAATVAFVVVVVVFDAMRESARGRRLWPRAVAAALAFAALASAIAGVVMYAVPPASGVAFDAVAAATFASVLACGVALALPIAIARRAFATYLRRPRWIDTVEAPVRERRRLPQALIVETPPSMPALAAEGSNAPVRRRAPQSSIQPFSSAEMAFFAEGDAYEN